MSEEGYAAVSRADQKFYLAKFYQEVHLFYFNPSTYKIGWPVLMRFAVLEVGKQILSQGEGKGTHITGC